RRNLGQTATGEPQLVEENQVEAHLRALAYKRAIAKLYNPRDKLALNWKGLYWVINVVQDQTYTLATMKGKLLPRTWHISNLRKFYI
ncbi:hypothetical protein B296_00019079, partial [Ensete ventricosum]